MAASPPLRSSNCSTFPKLIIPSPSSFSDSPRYKLGASVTMAFIAMAAVLYSIQGWNFKRLNRIRDNLTPEERQQWLDDGAEGDAHPGKSQVLVSTNLLLGPLHRDSSCSLFSPLVSQSLTPSRSLPLQTSDTPSKRISSLDLGSDLTSFSILGCTSLFQMFFSRCVRLRRVAAVSILECLVLC